ncbi:MAG: DUF853 family protein [Actinomycetota bacterium]|nr:DUF853 family protein [Actinomycetota bacterium]
MSEINKLLIAKGKKEIFLFPKMANRHGLIAGATGTGKTVSLKVMSEAFSSIGVPVFLADIKGDLATISQAGGGNPKIDDRIKMLELSDFEYQSFPTILWDVFGQLGHPVRTTISEMGPLLISRLLGLNDTQTGVLNIVFKVADNSGMMLIDLKDLRHMLKYVGDNSAEYTTEYGNISKQSIGAIQRGLLVLEEQGGNNFFAEPALDIMDFIKTDKNGKGYINVLSSEKLFESPTLYSTFLLWLLSELFEELPEVGDLEKPKIVFFFDEAHLLFNEAPKVLVEKIEQVVRLIRSKGVGVYFVTHNPNDLPDKVLGQLGNRIQHALRTYTPREQAAVKAAADTFRQNPELDVMQTITELKTGEALISFLDQEGRPSIVERAFVLPPKSVLGTIEPEQRNDLIRSSIYHNKYEETFDRESAYEMLKKKIEMAEKAREEELAQIEREKSYSSTSRQYDYGRKTTTKRKTDSAVTKMAKSAASSIGRTVGREIIRGIFGLILKR